MIKNVHIHKLLQTDVFGLRKRNKYNVFVGVSVFRLHPGEKSSFSLNFALKIIVTTMHIILSRDGEVETLIERNPITHHVAKEVNSPVNTYPIARAVSFEAERKEIK